MLVDWMGVSSAHLWGFCRGWYRRGAGGEPCNLPFSPFSVESGWSWAQWVQRCPAAREGWGAGFSLPAPWSGTGLDLETEHAGLGESPFRQQLPEEAEEGALLGVKALGKEGRELTLPRHPNLCQGPAPPGCLTETCLSPRGSGPHPEWVLSGCGSAGPAEARGWLQGPLAPLRPWPPPGAAAAAGPACPASRWSAAASSSPA